MDAVEQSQYVRNAYFQLKQALWQKDALLKLAAVRVKNPDWYDRHLRLMELVSSQIEAALMEANPHRAIRYVYVLSVYAQEVEKKMNRDFGSVEARLVR